eukprot:CAMPEP_0170624396 /NCGR_PEP_ID=MMETSP0224-20130122/30209_1 /TAXON_ID=285029 /ORGANISM="Togula jolla, Strain CCCM 725" /LENGTH=181 /DNA_ID=CAMNT_0010950913 /DNA_START=49 /DNA_END=594 /DNA_ORIENTATION=+
MGHAGQARCSRHFFSNKRKQASVKKVKKVQKAAPLKKTISPGSILILLAGPFRGRRVIFLKQLESGLLLVTGPYGINGVPIRRVNQAYCIGTSTKVDIKGVDCSKISDANFKGDEKKKKDAKSESSMFAAEAKKEGPTEEKKSLQKSLDAPLMKSLDASMKLYLKKRFSLSAREYPHEMKF